MATRVVTVYDILDGHVGLDLECFDRIYLNGWVHNLQVIFNWRIQDGKLVLQLEGETEAILETMFTARAWTKIA